MTIAAAIRAVAESGTILRECFFSEDMAGLLKLRLRENGTTSGRFCAGEFLWSGDAVIPRARTAEMSCARPAICFAFVVGANAHRMTAPFLAQGPIADKRGGSMHMHHVRDIERFWSRRRQRWWWGFCGTRRFCLRGRGCARWVTTRTIKRRRKKCRRARGRRMGFR